MPNQLHNNFYIKYWCVKYNQSRAGYLYKSTILYLKSLKFHHDGCSTFLPVNLLKESEAGRWAVVTFILIFIIKITPIEKNKKIVFYFHLMSGIMDTEQDDKCYSWPLVNIV